MDDSRKKSFDNIDNMIADMISNKNFPQLSLCYLLGLGTKYLPSIHCIIILSGTKRFKIISTTHFIMKIQNKGKLKQVATSHSSDIDFDQFNRLYRDFTVESYLFLFIDNTL